MLDRVAKRAKRIKELRVKTSKSVTYVHHIFAFLKEMERIYPIAKDPVEFDSMLSGNCKMLERQMKVVDPYVRLEIMWNEAVSWKDLRATGVKIMWSGVYVLNHPGVNRDEYVDITQALLEDLGILDEQDEETET